MTDTAEHPEVAEHLSVVREAFRWPFACTEGVTRGGEFQPCERLAVALRIDPEERTPYPVCPPHARGDMVSLAVIMAALTTGVPA